MNELQTKFDAIGSWSVKIENYILTLQKSVQMLADINNELYKINTNLENRVKKLEEQSNELV